MELMNYTRAICDKICKAQLEGRSRDKATLTLSVLRLIRGISSSASVLLTPTNSPSVLEFLCRTTQPPRWLVGLQAINWWRAWYLSSGKESLPSADLDSMINYGRAALRHIFASSLLLTKADIDQVTENEKKTQVVFEEDCEGLQLFEDDELNPSQELETLLDNRVELIYFRDIALEAVER